MKRYSIITSDLEHCIECGNNIELHEVFFGGRNRHKSIEEKINALKKKMESIKFEEFNK